MLVATLLFVAATGCSHNSSDPVNLSEPADVSNLDGQTSEGHMLWGIWDIGFDIDAMTADVSIARQVSGHFDVTDFVLPPACADCVKVKINSFDSMTRILDVDVTLKNPTHLTGYDVRGIFFIDDAGHELANADDWTTLYDIPGGATINPFKAFAKTNVTRAFGGLAEFTENYQVYIPIPPKYFTIKYAVDASWPGNCKEPYSIENFKQGTIYDNGFDNAEITVDVKDWQDDVSKVTLVAPDITGESFSQFSHVSGAKWHLYTNNPGNAPAGTYSVRVIASSPNPGDVALYDYFPLTVTKWGEPVSPADITPGSLNFRPTGIVTHAGYAYTASGISGMHLFDISDPTQPAWASRHATSGAALGIILTAKNVFVAAAEAGLDIFDITDPGSPVFVKNVPMSGQAQDVKLWGDYAYVATGNAGLVIVNVGSIDTAAVVNTVSTPGQAYQVEVDGDYAYVADGDHGLQIIDINPPGSASIIKSVAMNTSANAIAIGGGYAYICDYPDGIEVVDIDPPASASIVKMVATFGPNDVMLSANRLYVADGNQFTVIDTTTPASASIIGQISGGLVGWADSVFTSGSYAYVGNREIGFQVFDISVDSSPSLVASVLSPIDPQGIVTNGDYAYVAGWTAGLHVLDISSPSNTQDVYLADINGGYANDVKAANGYAFTADGSSGFDIFDLSVPDQPSYIKNVTTSDYASQIAIDGGYAYVTVDNAGIDIIDIDPPGSASIVNTVSVSGLAGDVAVTNGYAYVLTLGGALQVVDVDPVGSASVVKTLVLPDYGNGITLDGDYAYIADNTAGLVIVDISSPTSASIAKTVDISYARDVVVANGYAYVTHGNVTVVDVDPVDSASIYGDLPGFYNVKLIALHNNYCFMGSDNGEYSGVWVYRLW